jgi:hypothetical protein
MNGAAFNEDPLMQQQRTSTENERAKPQVKRDLRGKIKRSNEPQMS